MINDKNKEVYTSPITEALELRFEGTIMDASPWGAANEPGPGFGETPGNTWDF